MLLPGNINFMGAASPQAKAFVTIAMNEA